MLTDEHIKEFEEYLLNEEKSSNTVSKYIRDIRFFKAWAGEKPINKHLVLEYKKYLCERYAPASVNSMISSINALFAFSGQYELKIKALKIQRRIIASNEKNLTKSEYNALLDAAKKQGQERLYLLIQTIGATGIRVSELRYITADAVKIGQAVINCKGKLRQVFLPKQLCKLLLRYVKKNGIAAGSIFISKSGKPLDRSNVWRMMKSLCDSAGVKRTKVFPHNLRHLFAKVFYSAEKDIVRLADILGHSSINTTRIYTMETGESHSRRIEKLGLLQC